MHFVFKFFLLFTFLTPESVFAANSCKSLFSSSVQYSQTPWGFWTKQENITRLVLFLKNNNKPVYLHQLKDDPLFDVASGMIIEFGFTIAGAKIESVVRTSRKVPLWQKALQESGFPETWGERQKQQFIEVILERQRLGMNLNSEDFLKDKTSQALQVLQKVMGESVSPEAFRLRAMRKFKNWEALLSAAGVESSSVVKRSLSLSPRMIQKIIAHVYEVSPQFNFSPKNIKESDDNLFREAAFVVIGSRVSSQSIYRMALRFKPWAQWIGELQVDYRKVRRTDKQLTDEEIIKSLMALYQQGIPINTQAISKDKSTLSQNIIYESIGFKITPSQLYNFARFKKRWLLWISDTGLDITQIQLNGKIPYHLVNRLTKLSLQQAESNRAALLGDGFVWQSTGGDDTAERVRIDENDGESVLIQKEFSDAFREFDKLLSVEEQVLLRDLIDALEDGYELGEATSMIAIAHQLESPEVLYDLIGKISQHDAFRELFN